MKKAVIYLSLCLIIVFLSSRQKSHDKKSNYLRSIEYKNDKFRFSVNVPFEWKLFGEVKNDTVNQKALVDWGLPPIHSELEKTDIENSISILAYTKTKINSLDELMKFECNKRDRSTIKFVMDTTCKSALIIYYYNNNREYKGKAYYIYKQGTCYVITFMATPGTFDKNLKVFEEFYRNIKFY